MGVGRKAKQAVGRVSNGLEAERAKRDFRNAPTDLVGAVTFGREYRRGNVDLQLSVMQIENEILAFLQVVQERRPERIVEIGTAFGGTLFLLTRAAAPNATIVSVGMAGAFGGDRFGGSYPRSQQALLRSFGRERQSIHLVRGDSHHPRTIAHVFRAVGDRADLLLIDGDHTFEGVQSDFRDYRPLVHHGGLIAFHDINPGPLEAVGGVPDFWASIRGQFEHREFVEDRSQSGYGIGVLMV